MKGDDKVCRCGECIGCTAGAENGSLTLRARVAELEDEQREILDSLAGVLDRLDEILNDWPSLMPERGEQE